MAKKLLGSGSKGRLFRNSRSVPSAVGTAGADDKTPWIDPSTKERARNAGVAGVMLSRVLRKSKSSGIKPR